MGKNRVRFLSIFLILVLSFISSSLLFSQQDSPDDSKLPSDIFTHQEEFIAQLVQVLDGFALQYGGRIMPFERYSTAFLNFISGRNEISGLKGTELIATLISAPESIWDAELVLIDNPQILAALNLGVFERGRYSLGKLMPAFLNGSLREVSDFLSQNPSSFSQEIENLNKKLTELFSWTAVFSPMSRDIALEHPFRVIPLDGNDQWTHPLSSTVEDVNSVWNAIRESYDAKNRISFLAQLNQLENMQSKFISNQFVLELERLQLRFDPSPIIYSLMAFVLFLSLNLKQFKLRSSLVSRARIVVTGMLIAFFSYRLVLSMIISGRPPVTDLHSSVLFVIWILSIILLVGEVKRSFHSPVVPLVGLIFALELFAKGLIDPLDPHRPLSAILDTNFWLSIHVLIIVLAYSIVLYAALQGHVAVISILLNPHNREKRRKLLQNLQTTLRIALVLTVIGTVLGGLWAEQAWGRFWGWDPKENGAFIIIIWLVVVLHSPASNRITDFGTHVLASLLLSVVSFSWFGVNLMGVGFHSYGFTEGIYLIYFSITIINFLFGFITSFLKWIFHPKQRPFLFKRSKMLVNKGQETESLLDFSLVLSQSGAQKNQGTNWISSNDSLFESIEPGDALRISWNNQGHRLHRLMSPYAINKSKGELSFLLRTYTRSQLARALSSQLTKYSMDRIENPNKRFYELLIEEGGTICAKGSAIAPWIFFINYYESELRQGNGKKIRFLFSLQEGDSIPQPLLEIIDWRNEFDRFHQTMDQERKPRSQMELSLLSNNAELRKQYPQHIVKDMKQWFSLPLENRGLETRLLFLAGSSNFIEDTLQELGTEFTNDYTIIQEHFRLSEHFIPEKAKGGMLKIKGIPKPISVKEGQTLLEAMQKNGMIIHSSCEMGYCKTCKCKKLSGKIWQKETHGNEKFAEEDSFLSCISYIDGDAEVSLEF